MAWPPRPFVNAVQLFNRPDIGTPVGVQQKLTRHSDIRTTMNIYGDAATADMREAHDKIVGLALNSTGNGTEGGPSN